MNGNVTDLFVAIAISAVIINVVSLIFELCLTKLFRLADSTAMPIGCVLGAAILAASSMSQRPPEEYVGIALAGGIVILVRTQLKRKTAQKAIS